MDEWRDFSAPALTPLLTTALAAFAEHGYHGTTMRNLAQNASLSVPGLYHHFTSKYSMLLSIMRDGMADLYARTVAALAEAGDDPASRLDAYVHVLVLFHAHRGALAFVITSEMRSLNADDRARHVQDRDRQAALLDAIVAEGVARGSFVGDYSGDAAVAIVTMCTSVAQWYRPSGPLNPEQLASRYADLARRMLNAR